MFAVDSERQKNEWLHLIGNVVKVDNSSRKVKVIQYVFYFLFLKKKKKQERK